MINNSLDITISGFSLDENQERSTVINYLAAYKMVIHLADNTAAIKVIIAVTAVFVDKPEGQKLSNLSFEAKPGKILIAQFDTTDTSLKEEVEKINELAKTLWPASINEEINRMGLVKLWNKISKSVENQQVEWIVKREVEESGGEEAAEANSWSNFAPFKWIGAAFNWLMTPFRWIFG